MLENATNLTNTTSCVGILGGLLLFFSDYWRELSALAAIITTILVVIGLVFRWYLQKKQHEHEEKMQRSEQEYPKHEAKRILKERLEWFVSCWEGDKGILIEGDKKRKKELKKKLLELGNGLKKKVDEKVDLLPQSVARKAEDIANNIINFSNKITHGEVANENVERTKRINKKLIDEGDKLIEKVKKLIKKL